MKGRQADHPSQSAERAADRSADLARAALGHELGNLLHGLLGMADLALEAETDPGRARWLRAIRTCGSQLRCLLDRPGLLHGQRSEPRDFDGLEWLEQVVLSHAPAAAVRGCRLLLVVDPGLVRAWYTDPCLLRLALDNLVGNAVKYASGGDILLEVAQSGSGGNAGGTLVIDVRDGGPGLPSGLGEELFRPYVRGRESDRLVGGLGLGLFVCRDAVTALGGSVECRPSPRGACFRLTLPAALRQPPGVPIAASRLLASLHCRLLLEGAVARSVAAMTDRWGIARSDSNEVPGRERDSICLRVSEVVPAPGSPGPELELLDEAGLGWRRRLPGPLVESALVPTLLEAVCALSRRETRGSRTEPCPAEPSGGPGRRRG